MIGENGDGNGGGHGRRSHVHDIVSDQDRRQKFVRILLHLSDKLQGVNILLGEMPGFSPADGKQGGLGGREKTGEQEQGNQQKDLTKHNTQFPDLI